MRRSILDALAGYGKSQKPKHAGPPADANPYSVRQNNGSEPRQRWEVIYKGVAWQKLLVTAEGTALHQFY